MITIPTIAQLYSQIKSDIEAKFGDTIPAFGKNYLRAQAMVQAVKIRQLYLALAFVQKNVFVDTADPEANGGTLERFGRIKLGRNPFPAVASEYQVAVTANVGATISASQTFKTNDDSLNPGILFILDNSVTISTNPQNIVLRCLTPGLTGKLNIGDKLTATSPIANVTSEVTVNSENVPPQDAEDIETYRTAAEEAYRLEPQGGAASDYRLWALDAQGVQQTYPFAKSGAAGEINLYVEEVLSSSPDGKGSASASLLTAVEAVIEFDPDTTKPLSERGRRPLGVFEVHYLSVTPLNIDIQISGFSGITDDEKASIFSAIQEALETVRPFVAGADVLADKNDIFSVNNIITIILNTISGAYFTGVTMTVNAANVSTFQFTGGFIPYLSSITYV